MDETTLQIQLNDGSKPVLQVSGELTVENCDGFADLVGNALGGDGSTLALDLVGLDYVDSSGFMELVRAAKAAAGAGSTLSIVGMQPQFGHLLRVTGLKHLFVIDTIIPQEWIPAARPTIPVPDCVFSVENRGDCCREVRRRVCDFAAGMGFAEPQLSEIKMAVGEAIANAVRHGAGPGDRIEVRCKDSDGILIVTISYPSAWFDPDSVPTPDIDSGPEGGMGIYFMRLVMDRVCFGFQDGRVTVTLEKALPAQE